MKMQMSDNIETSDPRFRSDTFRNAVKSKLEAMGMEPTFSEFKKYDKVWNPDGFLHIDWLSTITEVAIVLLVDEDGIGIGKIGLTDFDNQFDPATMKLVEVW